MMDLMVMGIGCSQSWTQSSLNGCLSHTKHMLPDSWHVWCKYSCTSALVIANSGKAERFRRSFVDSLWHDFGMSLLMYTLLPYNIDQRRSNTNWQLWILWYEVLLIKLIYIYIYNYAIYLLGTMYYYIFHLHPRCRNESFMINYLY